METELTRDELISRLIPEINEMLKAGLIPLGPESRQHAWRDVEFTRYRNFVRVVCWSNERLRYEFADIPCEQGAALTLEHYRWRTTPILDNALRAAPARVTLAGLVGLRVPAEFPAGRTP